MTIEEDMSLYSEARKLLSSLEPNCFPDWLKEQSFSQNRVTLLQSVIDGDTLISTHDKLDILLYILKNICREKYNSLTSTSHLYSQNENYEYDPAKNGQNIVKHGISFSEVVSYSTKLGALMVQCPDDNDAYRTVMFSDLSNLKSGYKLTAPLNSSDLSDSFVVSVVQSRGVKLRFISSRLISKTNHEKTLRNSLKNIYPNDQNKRDEFIVRCLDVLKKNLIENNS